MAKPKTRPGGGSRKAPGVQKPKKLDPWSVPAEFSRYPPGPEELHEDGGLTLRQERFIDVFLEIDNATEAYSRVYGGPRDSAKTLGSRLARKQEIRDAIATRQRELADSLAMTREKLLRIQIAMATATIDDFLPIFRSAGAHNSYRGLGDKRYAIKSIKIGEFGNEVTLVDRQAAIDEIWKKLGFEQSADPNSERDVTGSVLQTALKILGKPTGEGSK